MRSRISALMDDELDAREANDSLAALHAGGEALEAWKAYHVISDALRDTRPLSGDFTARVAARLAEEPTVLAPAARPKRDRWVALSAAASVAAAALVAWVGFGPQPVTAPVAKAPPKIETAKKDEPVRVPPPEAAADYLLAHQGYSPRNSLQGVAPYVRTVSSDAAARKR